VPPTARPRAVSSRSQAANGHQFAARQPAAARQAAAWHDDQEVILNGPQAMPAGDLLAPGMEEVYVDGGLEPLAPDEAGLVEGGWMPGPPAGPGCADDPAPVYGSGTWFWNGCWYTQLDFAMMLWTNIPDRRVATDTTTILFNGQSQTVGTGARLSTQSPAPRYKPGSRLTVGHMLGIDDTNRIHAVEFTFFGLFDYDATAAIARSDEGLETLLGQSGTISDDVPGFDDAETQAVELSGDLDSLELNYLVRSRPAADRLAMHPSGDWVRYATPSKIKSMLIGVRYVSWDEAFAYESRGADPTMDRGRYDMQVGNELIGLHVGGSLLDKYDLWSWGLRGRLGGLVNFADRRSRVDLVSDGAASARSESSSDESLAFLAEAGLFGAYQLRPRLALRASYDVLYLSGVATAADNLGLGPVFRPLDLEGGTLLHGASIGLEKIW